jgi:cell division protein FtsB
MAVAKRKRSGLSLWVVMVSIVLLYLVFHALNGNHGLYAYLKEQRRYEVQQITLAERVEQKESLQTKVNHLSDDSLDLDLLDERARTVLGYSHPQEQIILENSDSAE